MEPIWYCRDCFFKIRRPISTSTFDGFEKLRYEQQKHIQGFITDELVDTALEHRIQQQNNNFFDVYDRLKTLNYCDNQNILKTKNQYLPNSSTEVIDPSEI